MRYLQLVLLLVGTASCAGAAAESAAFAARHRSACDRLRVEPSSLLEKIVARPDEFPYESWAQAHPEAPSGSLYKREIKAVIDANLMDVRGCYEDALRGWPEAEGRVTVRFGVGPSGTVDAMTVVSNETDVPPLACCIAAAVRSWRFRAPDGGGPVVVTYPFVLETAP